MDVNEPAAGESVRAPLRPARRLSRPLQVGVVLAGAGLVAVWLLAGLLRPAAEAPTPAPTGAAAAAPDSFKPTDDQWAGFKTAPVTTRSFSTSEFTDGRIAIDDDLTTSVYSPYTGRVTKLFAKAGDVVKAGDPLLALQASEFVQAANDLVAALATGRATQAALALAAATEKRQHELYLAQGAALKDWQQSQSDLANAQGNFSSAQVALGAVRNRLRILGKTDREVTAMETSIDPIRFSPDAVVAAPIAGTILSRAVGLGENIVTQAGNGVTPIFAIGDTSRVWLVANVHEVDAPLIHLGDAVEVYVLALPGRVFKARVTYVASSIDPNSRRLQIHAEIANPDGVLRPEMFANFRITTGQAVEAPGVPEQAIVFDPDGLHVWLVGPDHTLSIRKIRVGREEAGIVEVLDGLKTGDSVVTSGSLFIDRAAEAD